MDYLTLSRTLPVNVKFNYIYGMMKILDYICADERTTCVEHFGISLAALLGRRDCIGKDWNFSFLQY